MATAGLRKAAVLMMSLPQTQVAAMLGRLPPEQAEAVSREMARLHEVGQDERQSVLREFTLRGGRDFRGSPAKETAFHFLDDMEPEELAGLLADEHPQTVALVLSRLPSDRAAAVLDAFEPETEAAVLGRIARMEQPSREIVEDVATGLHRRLDGPVVAKPTPAMARIAKMFGAMKPTVEREVLGHIAQADPYLYDEIRRAMFGPDVAACGDWDAEVA